MAYLSYSNHQRFLAAATTTWRSLLRATTTPWRSHLTAIITTWRSLLTPSDLFILQQQPPRGVVFLQQPPARGLFILQQPPHRGLVILPQLPPCGLFILQQPPHRGVVISWRQRRRELAASDGVLDSAITHTHFASSFASHLVPETLLLLLFPFFFSFRKLSFLLVSHSSFFRRYLWSLLVGRFSQFLTTVFPPSHMNLRYWLNNTADCPHVVRGAENIPRNTSSSPCYLGFLSKAKSRVFWLTFAIPGPPHISLFPSFPSPLFLVFLPFSFPLFLLSLFSLNLSLAN